MYVRDLTTDSVMATVLVNIILSVVLFLWQCIIIILKMISLMLLESNPENLIMLNAYKTFQAFNNIIAHDLFVVTHSAFV